nr:apolipoprotein(a)-like isoform X2 [Misgurnus anguillicaudatus]
MFVLKIQSLSAQFAYQSSIMEVQKEGLLFCLFLFSVCLRDCTESKAAEDCMHCTGEHYRGKISTTETGFTCKPWKSQTTLPGKNVENNYCRNRNGERKPWCYSTNPSRDSEPCSIPRCTTEPPTIVSEFTCITGKGRLYRGTVSVTESGRRCQKWSTSNPHGHDRKPQNYPCQGLEENYCRNPDESERPWCYTTDPKTRWEYCTIPKCKNRSKPEIKVSEDCMQCSGEDYIGKISTTETGYTCQSWDSQKPHSHYFVLSILPEKNLDENYCRNPDGSPRPWCYTTNPSKRWEFCSIPQCRTDLPTFVPEHRCATGDGRSYRGIISVTESGKTCQKWASQSPHVHDQTPENYPCKGLKWNYCRNPDGSERPWCYTTDPKTRWEYCNVSRCEDQPRPAAEDCMQCNGEDYRGKISTTESGYTCQRWDSQTPQKHDYVLSIIHQKHLDENYCRNPDGSPRPWCYTTDPFIRWEFCSIPRCSTESPTIVPELICTTGDGSSYRGNISTTKTGKTCQKWASQTPHKHDRTSKNYPCKGLDENYCRNPDNERAPWCYTTDPQTEWEYCNVPNCGDKTRPEDCIHCTGEDYRGKISTTESGHTCQRWDSQTPHNHVYVPEILPEKNLEENFCRNPDGQPRPWCYTTNPSKRWEFCTIPRCSTKLPAFVPEHTCATGDGRSYRGIISVTKSGKTCQSWESQTPHVHFTTPEDFPCKGLRGNYCRNPDSSRGPWCYTSDPKTRWEYCNVSRCEEPEPEAEECIHCRGQDYRGKLSTTSNGYTCQRWELQTPHKHNYIPSELPGKYLEENYCRNPDTSPRPWCYTTDPSNRWDYCSIHQCTTKQDVLTCSTGDGVTYRGTVSVTVSGKTCQKWTSKTPHDHSMTNEDYPCGGLEENYCRNPDRRNGPFCLTTDPETRWEYCSVPICKDPSLPAAEDCMHCIGEDYRGKISITESGYTCQRWDSQKPHKHDYIPSTLHGKNLEENYCRNPTRKPRPWCYTTNPSKRWEYCSIPRCTTEPPTIVPELICTSGDGSFYRGNISMTKTGKTCQKWTSEYPHRHDHTPEKYPCKGLEENYCRNPDGKIAPWCYTKDLETEWEYCHVPGCVDQPEPRLVLPVEDCIHCNGEDYRGKRSITESGHTCQRWDSEKPHKHYYAPANLSEKHLEENYCRNPDGQSRPWCYTTNPSIRWEFCSIPRCTTTPPTIVPEFTCTTGDGGSYRGTISVTKSGKTCQKWTSQTPHKHYKTPENYPCKGLEENYCRNPDNKKAPWCYTTDPETRWEYCNVPNCEDPSRPDCMHCTGEDYRGKISITESGYTCQRWDSQTPHKHDFVLSILPGKHLEENYCRNPDGQPKPWCYTTNPSKRWEFCSIPQCTTTPPTIAPELTCTTGDGSSYRGTISVTKSGKTCQKWTSQTPHKHFKTPENYPCQGLEENYCRNPNNEKAPWCFTTDPETRWEYCNVHSCGYQPQTAAEDCMHCTGDDYRGKISITESGYTCQRWDSQTPHQHDYTPAAFPGKFLEKNYCRNSDGQPRPWCYTTNPSKRWEFCSIPQCTTKPPPIVPELTCITGGGRSYRGRISLTESGKTCQKWTSQTPHNHDRTPENYLCKGLDENYCRNPDNEKAPWCYTTDPETRWEYCNVPSCGDQPQSDCMHCTGDDYRGKISITESGYTCQRWDSQTPHQHDYTPAAFPGKFLEENYCRNSDGQPRPWCYTTNPSKRWEFCFIPQCTTKPPPIVPELTCITGGGRSYRGRISLTESGKTCQKWTSQTPHNHDRTPENYLCKGLEENYCRNPDNEKAPWCYTTDPETRWEYCSVPSCGNQPQSEDCMHCTGEDYRGKISITASGYTCQRWDSQTPHKHNLNPSTLPGKYMEQNYCRNPDGSHRPWCYTTNPSKRWEYCSIPQCPTKPTAIVPEFSCITGEGRSYRGTISVTSSGKTCQKWTSQTPHKHDRTPENYPCKDLDENYCRNPGDNNAPWCYTTDPQTRWEKCNVPNCGDQPQPDECIHCIGEDYRGKISITESGYTCQRWDSQIPHKHNFNTSTLPGMYMEQNYCRNPDGSPRPWCYTTNPSKRWEYCSIPQCPTKPTAIVPELTCITGEGRSYRGTISVTSSGKTCQKWTSQTPHKHDRTPENYPCKDLDENYCRNPGDNNAPWCYTTDPETRWENCNVPNCGDQPQPAAEDCMHCIGEDYKGKISTTESGFTCQHWDSKTPHKHDYTPAAPEKNLVKNYCRNPDGSHRPWCYTTNPSIRWEYCSIPQCTTKPPPIVPELTCITGKGDSYRGTISVTKSGKTCQKWTSRTPHNHDRTPENYPCKDLEENYCRNPDGSSAPWCYTTDPQTRWQYCNVPNCGV